MTVNEVLLSIMSVCSKIGIALASSISPMVLIATGYSAQANMQTASAQAGIKKLYLLGMAVGFAVSGFMMLLSFRKKNKAD
jgi:Na+/melibiose symporter-like transporter